MKKKFVIEVEGSEAALKRVRAMINHAVQKESARFSEALEGESMVGAAVRVAWAENAQALASIEVREDE